MLKPIQTENAPSAIGPYSQAIQAGEWLFISGQIPVNPKTNQIEAATVPDQTRQVLENLKAVLSAAGLSLDRVVKTTVFVKDLGQFSAMNEVYGTYFSSHKPARSTVEVSRLPKDVLVEIDAIAHR